MKPYQLLRKDPVTKELLILADGTTFTKQEIENMVMIVLPEKAIDWNNEHIARHARYIYEALKDSGREIVIAPAGTELYCLKVPEDADSH